MEDKKVSAKDKIKKFIKEDGLEFGCFVLTTGIGMFFGTKVYKKGFDDGHDGLANAIFTASQTREGILLSNKKYGDYIFEATKVLEK